MKPGNRTHNVKIIYDEVIPIEEGDGLDGNTPLDIDKDCKLQIRRIVKDDYGDPRPQPYEEFIITERPPCDESPDESS